jgi:autotransporter-associated beta strand protein
MSVADHPEAGPPKHQSKKKPMGKSFSSQMPDAHRAPLQSPLFSHPFQRMIRTRIPSAMAIAAMAFVSHHSAIAQVVFSESFEAPVVSGYVVNTAPSGGKWIASSVDYGSTWRGLFRTNVQWPAVAPFSTPFGEQAYFCNYSNSGLTTAVGATGQTLTAGVRYQVAFHAAASAGYPTANYRVELVAFGPADDNNVRKNCQSSQSARPGTVLAFAGGSVTTTDMSSRFTVSYTPVAGNAHLGKDLGIRLIYSGGGAANSVLYDNISLFTGHDLNPSPANEENLKVAGNVTLGWTNMPPVAPATTTPVDVWFGSNPAALTQVVDGQLVSSKVVSANSAGTWYWRVDSYPDGNANGTPVTGQVFSFTIADTDGDGIPDAWETQYFGGSTAADPSLDSDNDELTTLQEYTRGTNPIIADTDSDGLLDGVESASGTWVNASNTGTHPLIADTDEDFLLDGVETNTGIWISAANTGTNPNDLDWDKDGLKDGVESNTVTFVDKTHTGTDPFDSDTDNDGVGDWYEVTAVFTDPNNPSSLPNVPYPLPDPDSSTGVTNKPVKVYIMSGQSNMTGIGRVYGIDDDRSLENITIRQNRFPNLINSNGTWTVRKDVTYQRMVTGDAPGGLTAGQGSDSSHLGPELGFGHMIGWHHDEPVLLLKSSQGNRSLGYDILPPVCQAYEYGTNIYAGYGQTPGKWPIGSTPTPGTDWAGREFDRFFLDESEWGVPDAPLTNVVDVLDNFATQYPQWAAQGFQIAGFVWWQGDKDRYDMGLAGRYETNLVNLIQFLRGYYSKRYPGKVAPNTPFVLGTLGQTAFSDNSNLADKAIFDAQMAVDGASGKYPQFAGNVKTVYSHPLSEGGASNDHYGERAGTYMLVGDALGRAMIDLLNVEPDTNAPSVLSLNPLNGAANMVPGTNLVVNFNENIAIGTGNIILANLTDGTQTTIAVTDAAQVSVFGNTLTINPTADLTPSKQYAIRMEAGTVQDLWANDFAGITNDITWSFTTAALDLTAPTLFVLSPANSATNASADVNLLATFSEPIARGSGAIIITNLTDGTQTTIAASDTAQVSISGTTLTINPTANLTLGKQYAVRIAAGAVKDLADNPFAGILNDSTWGFTTEPPPATYYWDNNGTSAGFGTAGNTWSSGGGTLWNNDPAGGTVAPSTLGTNVISRTLDNVFFGTNTALYGLAAGTITVSGTVNAGTITFGSQNGAITLSGGTINLAAAGTITVGVNTTISSVISGAGTSFTKVGNSLLTLTGLNTYTGATYIGSSTNGVLDVTHIADGGLASGIGASSSAASNLVLAANNNGLLRYSGTTNASTDRDFTIGNTASYWGGFESSGAGTLTLTSTSAVSYITTNQARFFSLGGTNTGQNTLSAKLANNGTGALTFQKNGAGTWVLANETSSYTGSTTINGGILSVSKMANYGTDSSIGKGTAGTAITFDNSGALVYTGSGDDTDRLVRTARDGTILNNGTGALNFTATGNFNVAVSQSIARTLTLGGTNGGTISGALQNNTGSAFALSLAKTGTGTWKLGGTNTNTGATRVSGGILQFGKVNSLYSGTSTSWTAANIRVASGGTLAFSVGGTGEFTSSDVTTLFSNLANSTNATTNGMAAGSRFGFDTTNASGGSFEISQVIANSGGAAGGARGLSKLGTGILVLSSANTYTGPTTIHGGTLSLTGTTQATTAITFTGGSLGLNTGVTVTASSATVNLTNGTIQVTGSTGAASYTLLTAAFITGTPTLASPISGYILQIVGGNQLRLVQTSSPYDAWSGGALFGGDSNNDDISNGLAFLLGASGPNVSALGMLPTVIQSAGGLTLSFNMLNDAANGDATLAIEYGNSLAGGSWTAVQVPYSSGTVGDVVFNVSGSGLLNVTATIPASKAAAGKLFGRLKGAQP